MGDVLRRLLSESKCDVQLDVQIHAQKGVKKDMRIDVYIGARKEAPGEAFL